MNTLQVSNLCKTYPNGVIALDAISLDIGNGMFGLLGPNGAGKSSLMKTIAGLQRADSGRMYFNGVDVLAEPLFLKTQLGFLPQDFGVYPRISAYDLLMHIARLKGLTDATQRREQVEGLLDRVNLYTHRRKDVHTFSGGMRQRFGIAQALLGNPQLIIVDEPTAGLDPEERNRFNGLLSQIGENIIIILSTHLVEDVKMLCPRMAVMNHGRIIATGQPTDFIEALRGKLWQKTMTSQQAAAIEQELRVVSRQYSMGKLTVTVLADHRPDESFEPTDPTLEDAYFTLV